MRRVASLSIAGALSAFLFAASPVHAQEENKAAAEALFDEGQRLFDSGQLAAACAKFEASEKIDPASGTVLNLARCYEKTDRTASAWAAYRQVQALSRKEGNAHREAFARTREKELEPHLSRFTLVVPAPPAGIEVRLDGNVVDSAEWQTPVPIDPGTHVVDASAPGKISRKDELHIVAAQSLSFTLPALSDAPVSADTHPDSHAMQIAPAQSNDAHEGLGTMRVAALVSGGVGVVGIGVGAISGITAMSKASDAQPHCHPQTGCDSQGTSLRSDAGTFADVSTIAFIAGGVAIGAGVALWLVAPSRHEHAAHTGIRLLPNFDPAHRSAGLALEGAFDVFSFDGKSSRISDAK